MEFHGAKVAIIHNSKLLMILRDDKPGLFNANMWDFPGGGREGDETPIECVIRETKEELGIVLKPRYFVWQKEYPAQKDPDQRAWFFVAELPDEEINKVEFGNEGQRWGLMPQKNFFDKENVIDVLKAKFDDYLKSLQ